MYIRQVTWYHQELGCFLPPHGEKLAEPLTAMYMTPPHEKEDPADLRTRMLKKTMSVSHRPPHEVAVASEDGSRT